MATIGTLSLALKARTDKFNRGMKGAGRSVGMFGRQARSVSRIAMGLAGALGAVIGTRALVGFVKESFRAMDAAAKLADRINMTTEALTGLHHAANLTGLGVEALDKNIQMLQRRVGEAMQGTGEAVEAFELLGVSAENLAAMTADEQLISIAGAMEGLSTSSEKAAVSADIFGRSGVAMLNMLAQGEDGIRRMMRANEMLGGSFNRIDAAKIEAANDAITRMGVSVRGLANRIAVQLGPTVERFANRASFAFASWGEVGRLAVVSIEYSVVRHVNRLIYFYTKVIPSAVSWFARNWADVWFTLGTNTMLIFENLGINIGNIINNLAALIRGDMEIRDIWRPITEGWINTIEEEFKLPDRLVGGLEKKLKTEMDTLATTLGERWVEFEENVFTVPPLTMPPDTKASVDNLVKAMKAPGALEMGTREAFTAGRQPRMQAQQRYFSQSLKAEQDIGKKLDETNRLLGAGGPAGELAVATF